VIAKGSADRLKAQGIGSLRDQISALAPFLADRVDDLRSFDDVRLLAVAVDRLPLWHKPGLLSRVLGSTSKIKPPWFLQLFIYFPILRRLPARFAATIVPCRSMSWHY
jgi:hypothetical protein